MNEFYRINHVCVDLFKHVCDTGPHKTDWSLDARRDGENMKYGIDGWRWMVSPDGWIAEWAHESEVRIGWADCTEMSDAETMKLMERRMLATTNNEQLQLAA